MTEPVPTPDSADDATVGERGCRWSDARGRWEWEIRPGVSKEACGHLAHTRGDDLYMPDERPVVVTSATPDATPPADDATVVERKPATDRRVCPSCGGIAAVVWKSNPLRFWSHGHCVNVLVPATPPDDDANRAPVSGGLDEGERQRGTLACRIRNYGVERWFRESEVESILAARYAAWVERLAPERDTARREAGERIAQAIQAAKPFHPTRNYTDVDAAYDAAARIARADALTSDDGSGA